MLFFIHIKQCPMYFKLTLYNGSTKFYISTYIHRDPIPFNIYSITNSRTSIRRMNITYTHTSTILKMEYK